MTMTKGNMHDIKGLIREAYRIEGITESECRSVFLDWALSLPMDQDNTRALRHLLDTYEDEHANHPMTTVLRNGLESIGKPKRRGGWRARNRQTTGQT